MSSPRGSSLAANVLKITSWSWLGSSATGVVTARAVAGSGAPISGVWHGRTRHSRSNLSSVTGEIGRIGATVPSRAFRQGVEIVVGGISLA
eukprot:1775440-Pleurochrysis_carterae.AAC.3